VGDSILGQLQSHGPTHPRSTQAFTLSLNDRGWRASVKHRNAWRTARIRVLASESLDRSAQVLIVVSGSGDIRFVRESADPVAARAQVRRSVRLLIRDLQGVCAVWPTVPVKGNAGERRTARVMNQELDAAEGPQLRSPDWDDLAATHPGWFIADGVHLSRPGEAALQRTLLNAAHRCVDTLP